MPKKNTTYSQEDMVLWRQVTSRVTPLKSNKHSVTVAKLGVDDTKRYNKPLKNNAKIQKRQPSKAFSFRSAGNAIIRDSLKQLTPIDLRHGERAGIDGSTQRRLSRGEVKVDMKLDLHGMTAARAHNQLIQFIVLAASKGCRCVLVITGKGLGVLNTLAPNWLKQPPLSFHVLALAEAQPKDGGGGAFYVLLRRKRAGQ